MQIVLSPLINDNDKLTINNLISAVFISNNENIETFAPDKSIFISNNTTQDNADFHFDSESFAGKKGLHKIKALKSLSNLIFDKYTDPIELMVNFNKINTDNPTVETVTVTDAQPVDEQVAIEALTVTEVEPVEHNDQSEVITEAIHSQLFIG